MPAGRKGNNKKPGAGKKGGGKLRTRAVRDTQLAMQPQFDYNNAQLQQTQENYLRAQQAAQSASGGAFDMIGEARNPGFDRIADQFTQNLNALAPEFGGQGATVPYSSMDIYGSREGQIGMPENEVAAANALGGAIGSAGLSSLANSDARWGMLREGAQREATVFGRNQEAMLRQQMLDTLRQHENEQQNLMSQQPYMIRQRLDELKDQAIEQRLAKSKMRSDAAFSEALQAQLEGMIGGGGGGGGGRGGSRNRGGGGGAFRDPKGPQGPLGSPGNVGGDTQAGGNNFGFPGATEDFQTRGSVVQGVRNSEYIGDDEMPGWVRYAFNHGGADSLRDPSRARLYENQLEELLRRFRPPPVEIPGYNSGFTFG